MNFQVVPISADVANQARESLLSPQYKSLSAAVSIADGYGPCRSCLEVFSQGEDERLYFTYNSFDGLAELPDPGPVFIHNRDCTRFDGAGFPPGLRKLPLLLEAFGEESRLVVRERMDENTVEAQIDRLLADGDISFINLRNAEAGCFVARIDRAAA